MIVDEFYKKCKDLESEIRNLNCGSLEIEPISDGVINPYEYFKAKIKVIWILKESNDLINGSGGGWSLPEKINSLKNWQEQVATGSYITFQRMIYSSFGILNNFMLWKEMPQIYEQAVFETFKKIGYINIKKCPGISKAYKQEIQKAYNINKELLFRQLELYKPDIIIGGNTINHFFEDLNLKQNYKKIFDSVTKNTAYYTWKGKLIIDAYHPAYFYIKEEVYCNEIILVAKNWYKNLDEK